MTTDASETSGGGAWRTMPAKTIPGTLSFPDWCVERFAGSRRVLEIGCGPHGGLAGLAAQIGAEFCGMDVNAQAVAEASALWPQFHFVAHDAVRPFPPDTGRFDLVGMKAFMTCLPTREDHLAVLSNARNAATECCRLAIMDFLQNWDLPLYKSRYEESLAMGMERGTFAAPANQFTVAYKAHHFSFDELESLLRETGWTLERIESFPVVTRSGNQLSGVALLARSGSLRVNTDV